MALKTTSHHQPAYVLHSREYSETSLLIDVFTENLGKVSLLARGARRPRSRMNGVLQPFHPLLISWAGRGELLTLVSAELSQKVAPLFTGRTIISAFYMNELLIRLLQKHDPYPGLFLSYSQALTSLYEKTEKEWVLRLFECDILHELGYGLNLEADAVSGAAIQPDICYVYRPELGPVECKSNQTSGLLIYGSSLLALSTGDLPAGEERKQVLTETKQLLRSVLGLYLGNKPLATRGLFKQSLLHTYS